MAMLLARIDINVLMEMIRSTGSFQLQYRVHNFIQDNIVIMKPKTMNNEDVGEIRELFSQIKNFRQLNTSNKYPEIERALDDFYRLNVVPRRSPFYVVSMMSIFEGLISHNPSNNGPSITHQLKNKLTLLNNRFNRPIQTDFALEISFDNLITKLYTYRSSIAHGSIASFNGQLQALKNTDYATELIYSILKRLIVHALKEPQLIEDLRKC